ncbi:MAG: MarP family serine protease [Gordonia sp. (in: high G+C Gram-positive bacteria)]
MTGSFWVDVVVVGIALLAAASGYRQGAAASALAFLGVLLGVIAGILVAPHLVSRIDDARVRLAVALLLVVVLVIIGEISGMVLGRMARSGLHSMKLRRVDSCVGSALQFVAILLAAWLLAVPIRNAQNSQLASAVDGSAVINAVDRVAPDWLRGLPHDFTELLDSSGLKEVMGPFGQTQVANVDPPDETLSTADVVRKVKPSVLKIVGVAHSCGQALEGSGFVVAPERVMTNAHVVAGTDELAVRTPSGRELEATVVWFNSRNDVAVLDVPGLKAPSLKFDDDTAQTGADAIVLGYPEDGPFTVTPVRVRNTVNLVGPDIYQRPKQVQRQVYTVRGNIRSGNSGGPMVDTKGNVLGVVFGSSENPADATGFVLTAKQVQDDMDAAAQRQGSAGVSTDRCVSMR